MAKEFIGDCEHCHAPIARKTAWELVRDALSYDLIMTLPAGFMFTRLGLWLLGFAGGHAYTCVCPEKVRVDG